MEEDEETLADLLSRCVRTLGEAGIEGAGFEMQLLLAQALGVSRVQVITGSYPPPEQRQIRDFIRLVRARAARVPLAYLRGDQEFYGLPFRVTPAVLIPRPETELLVEFAIKRCEEWRAAHERDPQKPMRVSQQNNAAAFVSEGHPAAGPTAKEFIPSLSTSMSPSQEDQEVFTLADIGTGSGCIPVAFLTHCPAARAVGFDLSAEALALARENAERNGVAARLRWVQADLGTAARTAGFDLIVSNPPYIPSVDYPDLQPEVRDYEPSLALDGGPDGLELYPRLIAEAHRALKPDGRLSLEEGQGQAERVERMLKAARFRNVVSLPDLAGIERVVCGQR